MPIENKNLFVADKILEFIKFKGVLSDKGIITNDHKLF